MKYALLVAQVLCGLAIATLIASTIYMFAMCKDRSDIRLEQERHQQYQAWTKLYHREDLTFEEWNTLRMGNFLDDYNTTNTGALVCEQ